ncbi:MAG: AAA family ATPase [Thermodesulfovibrionia bacterium]
MAFVIAFSGKGGTGKTTLAALTIRYLIETRHKPILAIDADSNSCLNEALGVSVHATIGRLREQSLATIRSGAERPGGMSTEELFDYQVQQSIVEAKGFDLLVMGRPEGPGCYCAANNIIRKYTDKLSDKYPYVVLDNEAGMEHLSRRTTQDVDILFVVSDPSKKGILTAKRINELVDELQLKVKRRMLIINRVVDEFDVNTHALPFESVFMVPDDREIFRLDLDGRPVFELSHESPALKSLFHILDSANIP